MIVCGRNRKTERNLNEEFHGLYSSPNIIRVTKSRRMGWARHVARIGEILEMHTKFYSKNLIGANCHLYVVG
jgi:hypothetical protein